ncbi:hypothetical protein N8865_02785 [Francisellaceae bacterium]|nr:hypothetical protein [Francisellaceae bacterium]
MIVVLKKKNDDGTTNDGKSNVYLAAIKDDDGTIWGLKVNENGDESTLRWRPPVYNNEMIQHQISDAPDMQYNYSYGQQADIPYLPIDYPNPYVEDHTEITHLSFMDWLNFPATGCIQNNGYKTYRGSSSASVVQTASYNCDRVLEIKPGGGLSNGVDEYLLLHTKLNGQKVILGTHSSKSWQKTVNHLANTNAGSVNIWNVPNAPVSGRDQFYGLDSLAINQFPDRHTQTWHGERSFEDLWEQYHTDYRTYNKDEIFEKDGVRPKFWVPEAAGIIKRNIDNQVVVDKDDKVTYKHKYLTSKNIRDRYLDTFYSVRFVNPSKLTDGAYGYNSFHLSENMATKPLPVTYTSISCNESNCQKINHPALIVLIQDGVVENFPIGGVKPSGIRSTFSQRDGSALLLLADTRTKKEMEAGVFNARLMAQTPLKILWKKADLSHARTLDFSDGHLFKKNEQGAAIWAVPNKDYNNKSEDVLFVQADGNMVIYHNNQAVWSTGSACTGIANNHGCELVARPIPKIK